MSTVLGGTLRPDTTRNIKPNRAPSAAASKDGQRGQGLWKRLWILGNMQSRNSCGCHLCQETLTAKVKKLNFVIIISDN